MSDVFRTSDPQLATALIHTLSPDRYFGLSFDDSGTATFEFTHRDQCASIKRMFYGNGTDPDGFPETLAINDARLLLKTASDVYKSLAKARQAWQKTDRSRDERS